MTSVCFSSGGPSSFFGLCRPAIEQADLVVGGTIITQRVLAGRPILAQGGQWYEAIVDVDHVLKGHVGSQLKIQYFNGAHTLSTNYERLSDSTRYVLFLKTVDSTNSVYSFPDSGAVLETPLKKPSLPQGDISFADRMDIELAAAMKHNNALCRFRAINSIDTMWLGNRIRAMLPTLAQDKDKNVREQAFEILQQINSQPSQRVGSP